jgi:hypothetical protein
VAISGCDSFGTSLMRGLPSTLARMALASAITRPSKAL